MAESYAAAAFPWTRGRDELSRGDTSMDLHGAFAKMKAARNKALNFFFCEAGADGNRRIDVLVSAGFTISDLAAAKATV